MSHGRGSLTGGVARNLGTLCRITLAVGAVLGLIAVPYRMMGRSTTAAKPSYSMAKPSLDGFSNANVYVVNDRGEAVGAAWNDEEGLYYPFFWRDGAATALEMPEGAKACFAVSLNDRGEMTGAAEKEDGSLVGVVWRGTRVAATFGVPGKVVYPRAINNSGQVVGYYGKPECGSPRYAFVWSNGKMTDLGEFDPLDINDKGEVAGYQSVEPQGDEPGHTDPLIYRPGKGASLLPRPKHFPFGIAFGVNGEGVCAGVVGEWRKDQRAALWDGKTLRLPSRYPSRAYDINDNGQAVGVVVRDDRSEAALWDGRQEIVLSETVSGGETPPLLAGLSINQRGQISGVGLSDGNYFGYILTPKP